jgi:hypothetical protein
VCPCPTFRGWPPSGTWPEPARTREQPEEKRVLASRLQGEPGGMGEVVPELRRRALTGQKRGVVLTEGWPSATGVWARVDARSRKRAIGRSLGHGCASSMSTAGANAATYSKRPSSGGKQGFATGCWKLVALCLTFASA